MKSRRSVLATIAASASIGTVGCVGAMDDLFENAEYNPDGITLEIDRGNITGREVRWSFELDEGEYTYDYVELPGTEEFRFGTMANSGSVQGMLMTEREFDNNFASGDTVSGYIVETDSGHMGAEHAVGNSSGSSDWVVIATNAEHYEHEPSGPTDGRLSVLIQRVTRG
ncbi:hypothetical protein ACYJ1Y_17465 [Natrialbaceae archaeon A-gly3]